jgi:hypothetical protein
MSGSLSCEPLATPSDVLAYFSASHSGDPSSAFFSRLTP